MTQRCYYAQIRSNRVLGSGCRFSHCPIQNSRRLARLHHPFDVQRSWMLLRSRSSASMGWIVAPTGAGRQSRVRHTTSAYLILSRKAILICLLCISQANLWLSSGSIIQSNSPSGSCPANYEILLILASQAFCDIC